MHGLQLFGEYVWEVLVVSLLLAASALLIIPFIPMFIGVIGFFKTDKKTRRFKDIFTTIGSSFGTIVFYTFFELIIIVFPVLNIYFFNTHPDHTNYFVLAVCYIALVVGAIYLINAPIIIVNMTVTFRELLYNGFMLLFGGILRSILALAVIGGVVAIILLYPYVLPLTLYIVPFALSKLLTENFYNLKAKALKTSVYSLKHDIDKDDYINENGEVNHDETEKDR
ncbi:MAG: hypothetical protein J1G04_01860 [Clostridiales bacterium]|nr:hypothetical protein [Clostridiales bacterium]